jgi:hypothetical protein
MPQELRLTLRRRPAPTGARRSAKRPVARRRSVKSPEIVRSKPPSSPSRLSSVPAEETTEAAAGCGWSPSYWSLCRYLRVAGTTCSAATAPGVAIPKCATGFETQSTTGRVARHPDRRDRDAQHQLHSNAQVNRDIQKAGIERGIIAAVEPAHSAVKGGFLSQAAPPAT